MHCLADIIFFDKVGKNRKAKTEVSQAGKYSKKATADVMKRNDPKMLKKAPVKSAMKVAKKVAEPPSSPIRNVAANKKRIRSKIHPEDSVSQVGEKETHFELQLKLLRNSCHGHVSNIACRGIAAHVLVVMYLSHAF